MMISLTEEYINSIASNQNAILNGWGLVRKHNFVKLNISTDETVLFGECKGSDTSNYSTSVDLRNSDSPVFRCTCPSRQSPCKHALGLMYAYINGLSFATDEIPQNIVEKRKKAGKKEKKKKNSSEEKTKKTNRNALIKKLQTQKEGLELLEKIANNVVQSGLGAMDTKSLQLLEDQVKHLGNYYIPGAQIALKEFLLLFKENKDHEKVYTEAVDSLTRLYSICKKGKEYLDKKLNDPEMPLETSSTLEEWLGHVWQLSELQELGLVENDVELVQLSFNSYCHEARQELIDAGLWINLKTGKIVETRSYRPIKAAKHLREEDSFFSVLMLREMFVYPGDMNPRVRWENMTLKGIENHDFKTIKSHAQKYYPDVFKLVKNQIKNPLSDKYPATLLQFSRIGLVDGRYVMEDVNGQRIILADNPLGNDPSCVNLLRFIPGENLKGQAALVRFYNDMDSRRLYAQPLCIVTDHSIIRLAY